MHMQVYVCVICKVNRSPLYALSLEHRQILEAVISRAVNITKLRQCHLLSCVDCQRLIRKVLVFQQTALVGVQHLLNLLTLVEEKSKPQLQPADPPLLPVNQDLGNLLQVQSFVEFETEEVKAPKPPEPSEVIVKNEPEEEPTETKPTLLLEVEPERFSTLPEVKKLEKVEPDSSATESANDSCESDPEDYIASHSLKKMVIPPDQNTPVAARVVTDDIPPRPLVTVLRRNENRSVPFMDQQLVPIRSQGRGAATVGRGAVTVGRGTVNIGRGVVTVGRGTVTIRRGTVNIGRGAATVGRGTVTVGRGTVNIGRGAVTVGRGAATVGRGAVTVRSGAASTGRGGVTVGRGAATVGRGAATVGRGGSKSQVTLVTLVQKTPELPRLQPISSGSGRTGTADKPADTQPTQSKTAKMPRLQPISSGSNHTGTTDKPGDTQTTQPDLPEPIPWYIYVLSENDVASEREAIRKSKEYSEAEFRCEPCLQTFGSAAAVEAHAKLHLTSAGPYKCQVCTQYMASATELSTHRARHTVRYRCCDCSYTTLHKLMIEIHTCDPKELQKIAISRRPIRKRYRYPKPVKCKECLAKFSDEVALARHAAKRHSEPAVPANCKDCGKTFKNKYLLKKHSYSHKYKDKGIEALCPELFCAECKIPFATQSAYGAHRKSLKHSNKDDWQYECDYCGRKTHSKCAMSLHIKSVHTMERKYKCGKCPKAFVTRCRLRVHAATHAPAARPRPHVCERCGKAFLNKNTLLQHMNTHSGLRPYACKLCPATFSFSGAVYTHTRLKHLKIKKDWKKKGQKKKPQKKPVENVDEKS